VTCHDSQTVEAVLAPSFPRRRRTYRRRCPHALVRPGRRLDCLRHPHGSPLQSPGSSVW